MTADKKNIIYDCSEDVEAEFGAMAEKLVEQVRSYLVEKGLFDDDSVDAWYAVEVNEGDDFVDIVVRCELYWEEFSIMFNEVLDPIVEKKDPDAYFEMETGGRALCRFWQ